MEFLSKHEVTKLEKQDFKELWLDTDQFAYHLNNVRRRARAGFDYEHLDEPSLPTHVVVTGDLKSRYIFRADLAYDWLTTLTDIENDTVLYQEDALNEYARKNARLRFSFCPQPPRISDDEEMVDYLTSKQKFDIRKNYIDGVHVNATYTASAHYWLLRQSLKVKKLRIVSDKDSSIMTAVYRVFANAILDGYAHHFLCQIDRGKSLKAAYKEYKKGEASLKDWGNDRGYGK